MEKCTNGLKHEFHNSWGSIIHGYVGLCRCTRSIGIQEAKEVYQDNSAILEPVLIQLLMQFGHIEIDTSKYWYCASCNNLIDIQYYNDNRVKHFVEQHGFKEND